MTPHRGRRDQIDLATCTAAADAHQVPVTIPQCCRSSSTARQPSGGILSDTVPLVSLPLAVPFPAKCALSACLKLRVQSTSPMAGIAFDRNPNSPLEEREIDDIAHHLVAEVV